MHFEQSTIKKFARKAKRQNFFNTKLSYAIEVLCEMKRLGEKKKRNFQKFLKFT